MTQSRRDRLELKLTNLKKKLSLCININTRARLNAKISRLTLKLEN